MWPHLPAENPAESREKGRQGFMAEKITATASGKLRRSAFLLRERLRHKIERKPLADPKAWMAQHRIEPPADDPIVRFVIPIFSSLRAPDWDAVCGNLARTVEALNLQSSSQWTATICTQERPHTVRFSDKVEFVPFPVTLPPQQADKEYKQRTMIRHLAQRDRSDGYIFFLDGDDIPHPDLVQHIVTDNNGQGYHVQTGYMVDLGREEMALFGADRNADYPFYRLCGSSNCLRLDLRKNDAQKMFALHRGPHAEIPERAKRWGLETQPIPFPAMLYIFNHGQNDQKIAGHDVRKTGLMLDTRVSPEQYRQVLEEFQFSGEAAQSVAEHARLSH
jgi:hypothetical protein